MFDRKTVPPRSEEEMLKFMGLMNSSWVLDGHDIVTAFNLSSFQNIVDLGGKRLNSLTSKHSYIFVCIIHCLTLCLFGILTTWK